MKRNNLENVKVIHIFKDGTTTTELKDVYVPMHIVQNMYNTLMKGKEYETRNTDR